MLKAAVKWNVDFITKVLDITDQYEIDRIRYGIETLIGEGIKTLVVFISSLLINKGLEFCLVYFMMILFRSKIGGTHAKSFMGCLIRSFILFNVLFIFGDLIVTMPLIIKVLIILFALIVFSRAKYRTRLDKSGKDETLNRKLRVQLIFSMILLIIIGNIFFKDVSTLLLMTLLYIVVDHIYSIRSV